MICIYALCIDGDLNTAFYIGQTSQSLNVRFNQHKNKATSNKSPYGKMFDLFKNNNITLIPLAICINNNNALNLECFIYDQFIENGFDIINKRPNTAWIKYSNVGHKRKPYSLEYRKQISLRMEGKAPKLTAESRIKIGLAHKGKTISSESKIKMSLAAKNRPKRILSEATKAKISNALKDKKRSPISNEHRLAISKTFKGGKQSLKTKIIRALTVSLKNSILHNDENAVQFYLISKQIYG